MIVDFIITIIDQGLLYIFDFFFSLIDGFGSVIIHFQYKLGMYIYIYIDLHNFHSQNKVNNIDNIQFQLIGNKSKSCIFRPPQTIYKILSEITEPISKKGLIGSFLRWISEYPNGHSQCRIYHCTQVCLRAHLPANWIFAYVVQF